ncbi:MAG: hypothetical protein EOM91_21770 [Sphingobacteriia bacterium]|nr:hypothetical protein [Sphingobacteriia bacterium]
MDIDGKRVPVKWEHILGHKERLGFGARVVDQGDDGAIVEDDNGQRHYMEGLGFEEPEPQTEPTGWEMALTKAMVLFLKGFPPKDDGDDQAEDADGPQPKTPEVGRAKGKAPAAAPEIKPGAMVLFLSAEGDKLKGKVVASGADGVTVEDDRGGEHRVEHGDYRPDAEAAPDDEPDDTEQPEPDK